MALFTIDWECWNSFEGYQNWNKDAYIDESTHYLLDLLRRHDIKAIFYCVGWLAYNRPDLINLIESNNHIIGDHTQYHTTKNHVPKQPFRAPKFKGEKKLYSGGFWFRVMPYWWIKREVEKTGIFYIHPHDILFDHPDCGNPLKTFERRLGLKNSRDKLERLVREVEWEEASQLTKS